MLLLHQAGEGEGNTRSSDVFLTAELSFFHVKNLPRYKISYTVLLQGVGWVGEEKGTKLA